MPKICTPELSAIDATYLHKTGMVPAQKCMKACFCSLQEINRTAKSAQISSIPLWHSLGSFGGAAAARHARYLRFMALVPVTVLVV